ncbi:MAG TPA: LysR substrate-binding domain-containing protein [Allosphingosinicella sp.]|jgi:LysR family glycine cleavage system transcriptional activator
MRHIPPLPAVRVFEAAARHENFTTAAAELGMTQAAVSYQIRLLEERLGVPLFVRSKRRVTLSEAGRKVAPLVSGAFDDLSEAFEAIVDADEGVLSISTTQTFATNWMAPRLGSFQVERPELAVRLKTENKLIDFAAADADVGIRSGLGDWAGLRRHFLFQFHSTPMCSPGFLEAHPLARPEDILKVPRISAGDSWWKRWLECAGVAESDPPRGSGIWLDSQAIEGNAAMAGHGLAMLSPIFWRQELAAGRLVQPFPIVSLDGFSYWLVYPEHKRAQPKIRAFRDWLLRQVALQAEAGPPEVYRAPPEA